MKPITKFSIVFSAALTLAACAPVNILNALTPSSSFTKAADVSYGPLDRQALDIYKADNPKPGAPILVFTHGGSWDSGSKKIYKFFAEGFTREGYTVAVPNYRLYPEARFPDMIVDTTKAIKFVADSYPDTPLVVMGHSAGAYNTLMAVMNPQFAKAENLNTCARIAGVVAIAPPTGIIPLKEEPYITIFPDRFTSKDAPLNQTENTIPPMLLVHGLDDKTVYPQNSQKLAELINARGGDATVKTYAGLSHIDVIKVISKHFDGDANVKPDVIDFIDKLDLRTGQFCQ